MSAPPQPASGPSPTRASAQRPRLWGLIPCAGTGSRAGTTGPKQYRELAGQPLIGHTMQAFAGVDRLEATLVVLAPGDQTFSSLVQLPPRCRADDCGGETRAASVYNGLNALREAGARRHDWVLVHDAARCLIESADINRLIDACLDDEVGGLLALPLADTLKQGQGDRVQATLSRADKWLAQTPQMFRIGSLMEALESVGAAVTDESSAIEAAGLQPRLVLGQAQNLKVTYPQDFELAELILHSRQAAWAAQAGKG
jgi:2-C-methyl-D-erythritol 4-phosphate cytidylyltransferase